MTGIKGMYEQARMSLPAEEFSKRTVKVQSEMGKRGLDILIVHSCECESANVRYLSNFWPVFDFAGVLVPRKGTPVLLTGGPESYDFAKQFSRIEDVRIHPLYVESNAPEWDLRTETTDFSEVIEDVSKGFTVRRIGICNSNLIPFKIMEDIKAGAGDAEFVYTDDIFTGIKAIKSDNEIALMKEAYKITEEALKEAMGEVAPGKAEWEVEAAWRKKAYEMGAEGTGFPVWVTSGASTYQSLCRSTDRVFTDNDMVQLTFGAKYNGYCGTMCRPMIIGSAPDKYLDMMKAALEALEHTCGLLKPWIPAADVYEDFRKILTTKGYENCTLYGPAHGTGLQECEGPWVDNRAGLIIQPNMVLNVDVWISDGVYGVRYEDGVLITGDGALELTGYKREIIRI